MLRRGLCLHNLRDVPLSWLGAAACFVLLRLLRFSVPVLLTMCHRTVSVVRPQFRGWSAAHKSYHSVHQDGGGCERDPGGDASCSRRPSNCRNSALRLTGGMD